MENTIGMQSSYSHEFWNNVTKYSAWSKGEYEFLKEVSFIMVTLRNEDS